jgi:hypothetical protein
VFWGLNIEHCTTLQAGINFVCPDQKRSSGRLCRGYQICTCVANFSTCTDSDAFYFPDDPRRKSSSAGRGSERPSSLDDAIARSVAALISMGPLKDRDFENTLLRYLQVGFLAFSLFVEVDLSRLSTPVGSFCPRQFRQDCE